MNENISPEEKLLRLIRGQKKNDIVTMAPGVKFTGAKTIKPGIGLPGLSGVFKKYRFWFSAQKAIRIFFALACLYLAVSLAYPWLGLKRIKLPKDLAQKINAAEDSAQKKEIKPYDYYASAAQGKNLFGVQAGQQALEMPLSGANVDAIKNISLVGIISGDNPQAIVEDKNTQKSYYLTKGQFIGEFQLEEVQDGKIILNYHGQKYELYL